MVRIEFNRQQKRAIAFDEDTLVGECTFEENDNVWNINEVVKVLEPLAKNSDETFKKHLARMAKKKEG